MGLFPNLLPCKIESCFKKTGTCLLEQDFPRQLCGCEELAMMMLQELVLFKTTLRDWVLSHDHTHRMSEHFPMTILREWALSLNYLARVNTFQEYLQDWAHSWLPLKSKHFPSLPCKTKDFLVTSLHEWALFPDYPAAVSTSPDHPARAGIFSVYYAGRGTFPGYPAPVITFLWLRCKSRYFCRLPCRTKYVLSNCFPAWVSPFLKFPAIFSDNICTLFWKR